MALLAIKRLSISFLLIFVLLAVVTDAAGHKPKKVRCKDKKYTTCYKKDLFCPDACLRTCVVDCNSCQPVCIAPPPPPPSPPPPPPKTKRSPPPPKTKRSPPPPYIRYPSPPPPTTYSPPTTPTNPIPSLPPPPPPGPTSTPPLPPFNPPPVSPAPPATESSPAEAYCRNQGYPFCYKTKHTCPSACPNQCEVDCVTCSPVCDCNRPGAVCQDPRFIGADGLTFYFHGKKDNDFCILSDPNLHINAHFIGKRIENMTRDFTWVQSLGILFDTHTLTVSAKKTAIWDDSVDRLSLSFDQEHVFLPASDGATWRSKSAPSVIITRTRETNGVVVEVEGKFKIKVTVLPITDKESTTHNYGITEEDCFAHLDLGFKFYSLSSEVNGVLGQTYANNYISRVKMGVDMPVLGGDKEFVSSTLLSTDCVVSRFNARFASIMKSSDYADLNCSSGIDGRGVVCKR